jgi:hypothetical protein
MSLLWTNIVTAVATLVAALGGTYIKGVFDSQGDQRRLLHERKSRRIDIRADAYSDFLKAAHADARLLGQTIMQLSQSELDVEKLNEIVSATSTAIDDFNSSRARLEIVGTSAAAAAAVAVATAARVLGSRCSRSYLQDDQFDSAAAEVELAELSNAIETFAVVCRGDLGGDA